MKLDIQISKTLDLPFILELSENPEADFLRVLHTWELFQGRRLTGLVLTGSSANTVSVAERYAGYLKRAGAIHVVQECVRSSSLAEVARIKGVLKETGADFVTAVGAGKVIDVAKAVIAEYPRALIAIPSALSSDGVGSPVSVLRDEAGRTGSYPAAIAACIFVDLSIVSSAPAILTMSGMGDVLSNASALCDLADAEDSLSSRVNGLAKILSANAYQSLLDVDNGELQTISTARKLGASVVLSGLAMALSGNSRPCSGAEHLISHAIDHMKVGSGTHGVQVAAGTLYCAALRTVAFQENRIDPAVTAAIRRIGIPATPAQFGLTRQDFLRAVSLAPRMRAGRVTFLDTEFESHALEQAFELAFEHS
ncbi:iron-containing alcohol dehydrogenase [Ramlibacter sp.]|uniref:iron-containing alcohol dehydrogenase n=1 Tax=Ramlibacter sp. TaxID=1917967 RepID=UPI00261231A3|nr:iron-containing alcohol dehydrogenase [Ramlibacter sp.]MDB5957079.1 araM [Ramlibacter sp.]